MLLLPQGWDYWLHVGMVLLLVLAGLHCRDQLGSGLLQCCWEV